jgi:RNA polymerase sigma factor (sigma-70 family)
MDSASPGPESAKRKTPAVNFDQVVTDRFVLSIVRRKARLIVRCFADEGEDVRDVEQELFLRLLQNLRDFDSKKGALNAFISVVVERLSGMLIRERRAKKRTPTGKRSLGAPCDGGAVFDPPGLHAEQHKEVVDRALDVAELLAALPPDLRDLAERLQTRTVSEVARDRNVPRTSLQRHIERLKRCIEVAGLNIYLE